MKQIIKLPFLVILLLALSVPAKSSVTIFDLLYRQCDVDEDGSVTASDITVIYNYLLGGTGHNWNSDVDHDGNVTSADVTLVYDVMLNGGQYNSISNAFALNLNYPQSGYLHFYWDDVTANYDVYEPNYVLVLSVDPAFPYHKIKCVYEGMNEYTLSNQDISDWLQSIYQWNEPDDVPNKIPIYARVEVFLDNGDDVIISNELQFNFSPQNDFASAQPIHLWWLIGSFVGTNHWSNNSNPYYDKGMVPMYPVHGATYDVNGEGPLEYYGYFPSGGEFTLIENPGSWDKMIGGGNENGGQLYSGNTTDHPGSIIINQGGYYKIDLNTVSKTMTMTCLSDNQPSYNLITMPGDYQGWNVAENAMTAFADSDNHDWFAFLTLDNDGELKFAAGNWTNNWGASLFPFGKGYQDGDNIPARAGEYIVYFNDLSGDYMFVDDNGLPGSNYISITKNMADDYLDLTRSYASDTRIKLCDIVTNMAEPYSLHFNSTSIPIASDGTVDINEFQNAVLGTYNRPYTGADLLKCKVKAHIGDNAVVSNTISIPVQVENFSIVLKDGGDPIAMHRSGYRSFKGVIPATGSDILFNISPESPETIIEVITPHPNADNTDISGNFIYGSPSDYFVIPYNPDYVEYEITIDFESWSYFIEGKTHKKMLWQVGAANNWGNPSNGMSINYADTYVGYMFLNGDFRFRENESNWDGKSWGAGNSSGTLAVNGNNLYAPQGFYKVEANLDYLTYSLTNISSVSIIGSAVPTGAEWATDLDLTYNQSTGAWEGTYVLNSGEYKFRANHDWLLNWGGTTDSLVADGANLVVSQPGPYKVQVYLTYDGNSHASVSILSNN